MEVFKVFATMSLVDMISSPLGKIDGVMKAVTGKVEGLSNRLGKLTVAMAPIAVTAAIVAGALFSTALAGVETERSLNKVSTLGIKDLQALERAASDASNNMDGMTKAAFINAAYDIKSGIASLSDQGVADYTRLAAVAAQATQATVAEMTSLGATAYNVHKSMFKQMSDMEFGAMLYAGIAVSAREFKTTGPGMEQAMKNLGAAATTANVPLSEQLAILGTLQGSMEASVAGTAYKAFMRDASKGFKALGVEAIDPVTKKLRSMPELLAALEEKLGPIDQIKLDTIGKAFGDESANVIKGLIGKSGDLAASIATVNAAMQEGASFTENMAAVMNQGLGPTLTILGQRWHNLLEVIGKHFAPTLTALAAIISLTVLRLQDWAASPFGAWILKAVAWLSLALIGFTALCAGAFLLTKASLLLLKVVAPLKTGFLALKGVLLGISWPVWSIIAAFAALYLAYTSNFGGFADFVNRWWTKVSLVFRGVTAVVESMRDGIGEIRGELAAEIKANGLVGVVTTVSRIIYRLIQLGQGISAGFTNGFAAMGGIFDRAFGKLGTAFSAVGTALSKVFGTMSGPEVTSAASEWERWGVIIGQIAGKSLQTVATALLLAVNAFTLLHDAARLVIALFTGDFAGAGAIFQGILATMGESILAVADLFSFGDWLRASWQGAMDFLGGINLYESGSRIIDTIIEGITAKASAMVDSVKGVFARVRNLLPFSDAKEGPLSELTTSGGAIMTTLGQGIMANAGGFIDSISSVFSQAGGLFGKAKSWLFGDDAVKAPELALSNTAIPEPKVPDAPGGFAKGEGKGTGNKGGESRSLTISIGNITLPDVSDAKGFVAALQNLVAEYDGVPA